MVAHMDGQESEVVILVHGTGASEPGAKGEERWWQPEGAFAQETLKQLSIQATEPQQQNRKFVVEAFVWSGANSERQRRLAGQMLSQRLAELERRAIPFHLVGHSHGGSVIWHALKRMLRDGNPESLRSWITVGTPFLTFGDRGGVYLFLFSLMSVLTVGTIYLLLGGMPAVYWTELGRVFRDAPLLASMGAAVGCLVALGLAGYSVGVLCLQLWRRFVPPSRRLSVSNLAFAGQRWLPVAHAEDEPISLLRASVVQPAEPFIPRLKASLATGQSGKYEGTASGIAPRETILRLPITLGAVAGTVVTLITAPFYNRLIAPLLDQFLWETVKGVVQGKDVAGEYMTGCDSAPPELKSYWAEMSPHDLERLSTLADASAAGTARLVRSRLAAVGLGTLSLSAFRGALSWKEVIHTAYFEPGCGVAEIVAGKIAGSRAYTKVLPPASAVPATSMELHGGGSRPFRPRLLYSALALSVSGACAAASFSTVAVERAWLWPFTNAFQVEQIYRSLSDARPASLRILPRLNEILIRWVLLDRTEDAIATSLRLDDMIRYMGINARLERLQDVAFAIGLKGSESELADLLSRNVCAGAEPETSCLEGLSKEEVTAYLLVHAVAGARIAKNGFDRPAARQLDEVVARAGEPWWRGHIVRVLMSADAFDLAEGFAGTDEAYCDGVKEWAGEVAGLVLTDQIPGKLRSCLDEPIADYLRDQAHGYRNYYSDPAEVLRQLIASLPPATLQSCQFQGMFAVHAMRRCELDRDNLLPIFEERKDSELVFSREKSASEVLYDISGYADRFGNEPPACLYALTNRLQELATCLSKVGSTTRENPVDAGGSETPEQSSSEARLSWLAQVWNIQVDGTGEQPAICGNDDFGMGKRYGQKMQQMSRRLRALTKQDRDEVRRLVLLRTEYESRRRPFSNPQNGDSFELAEDRCGWALLGLAWVWLDDEARSARLFDAVLPKQAPTSGTEMLDFYLGIADAVADRAPQQAKRFLDQSLDLVDDNDPSLFFQTSDGSVDEFFAYGKADISPLYARIGEYRLAALTNDRVSQLDEGEVSGYLTILDAEIGKMNKYDEKVLNAVSSSKRLPGFRLP